MSVIQAYTEVTPFIIPSITQPYIHSIGLNHTRINGTEGQSNQGCILCTECPLNTFCIIGLGVNNTVQTLIRVNTVLGCQRIRITLIVRSRVQCLICRNGIVVNEVRLVLNRHVKRIYLGLQSPNRRLRQHPVFYFETPEVSLHAQTVQSTIWSPDETGGVSVSILITNIRRGPT